MINLMTNNRIRIRNALLRCNWLTKDPERFFIMIERMISKYYFNSLAHYWKKRKGTKLS